MENKTNKEELIQETEIVEEEALKADKQKTKKILKRILIGTGAAAILGGIIAAVRANSKKDDYCEDYEDDSDDETDDSDDEAIESDEDSESN